MEIITKSSQTFINAKKDYKIKLNITITKKHLTRLLKTAITNQLANTILIQHCSKTSFKKYSRFHQPWCLVDPWDEILQKYHRTIWTIYKTFISNICKQIRYIFKIEHNSIIYIDYAFIKIEKNVDKDSKDSNKLDNMLY
jgi:hypothetical protein